MGSGARQCDDAMETDGCHCPLAARGPPGRAVPRAAVPPVRLDRHLHGKTASQQMWGAMLCQSLPPSTFNRQMRRAMEAERKSSNEVVKTCRGLQTNQPHGDAVVRSQREPNSMHLHLTRRVEQSAIRTQVS